MFRTKLFSGIFVFGVLAIFLSVFFLPSSVKSQTTAELFDIITTLRNQISILQARILLQTPLPTLTTPPLTNPPITLTGSTPLPSTVSGVTTLYPRNLDLGSTGEDVARLQQFLINKNFLRLPTGTDKGSFGPLTKLALSSYQRSVGITPALGYFGPTTRRYVSPPVTSSPVAVVTSPITPPSTPPTSPSVTPPTPNTPRTPRTPRVPRTPGVTPTLTISATPTNLATAGLTSTLTWSSTNATRCNASNGWSGRQSNNGTLTVTPQTTTTYILTCINGDQETTHSVSIIVASVPPTNLAPNVSAGNNQSITLPTTSVTLRGTASDDGLPTGSTLSTTWTKVSGPGTVTFSNDRSLTTTATFSSEGRYFLKLTGSDSLLTDEDTITITVEAVTRPPDNPPRGGGTNTECTDGNDNDNDGQVDFADFGCSGPNYQETQRDYGFTLFTPSSDTRIIYVSDSLGNDTYTGLCAEPSTATTTPICGPKKTIAAGVTLLRNGYPDWVLLKRGDTWMTSSLTTGAVGWGKSGRSVTEPTLLGSYGSSTYRPLVKTGSSPGIGVCCSGISHTVFSGIEFYADARDPSSPTYSSSNAMLNPSGIRVYPFGNNVLFEDMKFSFYGTNILFTGNLASDISLRRNVVVDAYTDGAHSQGFFGNFEDLFIEDNVFDHNGWYSTSIGNETVFNHNVYLYGEDLEARNNIIARASSHGMQARKGGIIENNLFLRNAIHLSYGLINGGGHIKVGGVDGKVENNVFTESKGIGAGVRGWVIELANIKAGSNTGFRNNVITNPTGPAGYAIYLSNGTAANRTEGVGINDFEIVNNVFNGWRAVHVHPNLVPGGTGEWALNGLIVTNNKFQNSLSPIIYHNAPFNVSAENWNNNTYYTSITTDLFRLGTSSVPWITWNTTVDPTSTFSQPIFPDSSRTVGSYAGTLGLSATTEAFLAEARLQSRTNWRIQYTADAVNDYIRAGFGMRTASDYRPSNLAQVQAVGDAPDEGFLYNFIVAIGDTVLGFFRWIFGWFA